MPRLARPALRRLGVALALAAAASVPPGVLHEALAAAAGTVFEAAPFVLAAAALRTSWAAGLLPLAGCGCGRAAGPGALSLPATALCWLAFGPIVAVGRFGAAVALAAWRPRRASAGAARAGHVDPQAELARIAATSLVLGVALALATRIGVGSSAPPGLAAAGFPAGAFMEAAAFAAGVVAGSFAPCVTAAVAAAAVLRHMVPAAAAGLLLTAGLVDGSGAFGRMSGVLGRRRGRGADRLPRDARSTALSLAVACAGLVAVNGRGFTNPRLVPAVAAAAVLFLALPSARHTVARAPFALPALLATALLAGSPEPQLAADATNLAGAFPGATLAFTGRAHRSGHATTLVRYAIACCRADASAIVVQTAEPLRAPEGTWVTAAGQLARAPETGDLVLRVRRWHAVAPPADPFVYR